MRVSNLSCLQINLLASLLLMRTSSSRSLALTCLYSLYSSASGERSSFCTFLRGRHNKHRATCKCRWKKMSSANASKMPLFSPSVLPQELVLELLQVLAQPLLLLSGLLELHHQLLPAGGGETPLLNLTADKMVDERLRFETYVVAACRLDSLMSVVFLEGDSSSTGEMKPSASSSTWSRKLMTLTSGRTLTVVNCVLASPSSSEPSSSSCGGHGEVSGTTTTTTTPTTPTRGDQEGAC